MTRISYEKDFPGAMRLALRRVLNHELRDLYREHGIDRHEVYEAIVVANSTMRDLFFGPGHRADGRVAVPLLDTRSRPAPARRRPPGSAAGRTRSAC